MPRYTTRENGDLYRVTVTRRYRWDGIEERTFTETYGPYHSLAVAKGVGTRESQQRWYRPEDTFEVLIEKASTVWEVVDNG